MILGKCFAKFHTSLTADHNDKIITFLIYNCVAISSVDSDTSWTLQRQLNQNLGIVGREKGLRCNVYAPFSFPQCLSTIDKNQPGWNRNKVYYLRKSDKFTKKTTKGMFVRLYNSTCNWSFVKRNNFGKQHFIYAKQWSNGTM